MISIEQVKKMSDQDKVALCMIMSSVSALTSLSEVWEPCGSLIEDVKLSLMSEGGLQQKDIDRLHQWSKRWAALDPRLRLLYIENTQLGAVNTALWSILNPVRSKHSGSIYWVLRNLWVDKYGYYPPVEMIPKGTYNGH